MTNYPPTTYSWREYNWIGLPMCKKHGDFWEVHDLNIDHPAARYIENDKALGSVLTVITQKIPAI